jgi:hypothetical protein
MSLINIFAIILISITLISTPVRSQDQFCTSKYGAIEVNQEEFDALSAADPSKIKQLRAEDEQELEQIKESLRDSDSHGSYNFGNSGGGGGGRELALVIFVVVGLVILLAWVPYFPTLAYKAVSEHESICFQHQFDFKIQLIDASEQSSSSSSSLIEERSGYLKEIQYSLFLSEREDSSRKMDFGLSFSLGEHHIKDRQKSSNFEKTYDDYYFLLGPTLKFTIFDNFMDFYIDLAAGESLHNEINSMAVANLKFQFYFSNWFAGLFAGGVYMDIDESRGIISSINDIFLTYGFLAGTRF